MLFFVVFTVCCFFLFCAKNIVISYSAAAYPIITVDVYIEYVIIDNMVINSILLFAAAKTLKISARTWRILLSAALGTAVAAVSPLVVLPAAVLYALKAVLAACMVLLLTGVRGGAARRKFIWAYLLFIAYTFLLGGILIGVFLSGKSFSLDGGTLMYSKSVPLGLYAAGMFLFAYGVYNLTRRLKSQKTASANAYFVRFTVCGVDFSLTAYRDSGNTLMLGDVPVCFVTGEAARQTLKKLAAEAVLADSANRCEEASGKTATNAVRFVNFSTVGGRGRAAAVLCPDFGVYESASDAAPKRRLGVYVAAAPSRLRSDFQVILNNSVVE